MKRREFIKASGLSVLGAASSMAQSTDGSLYLQVTPSEIEGPFYPLIAQKDTDFDLTKIKGHSQSALGEPVHIEGRVVDTTGKAIENAEIDLWQANAVGKYRHPRDPNPALIDDNFQGWAIVHSGKQGRFRFKTVIPGTYDVGNGWVRPPHIHFKVTKPGYEQVTTQMYFPDQPLNDIDRLLQNKRPSEKKLMIAERIPQSENVFKYNLILQKT